MVNQDWPQCCLEDDRRFIAYETCCGDGYFFSSIGLFKEFLSNGIYAMGTVRPNWVGLPSELADTKSFKNHPHGHTLWRMNDSQIVSCVMWKDKKPLLLISTNACPIH